MGQLGVTDYDVAAADDDDDDGDEIPMHLRLTSNEQRFISTDDVDGNEQKRKRLPTRANGDTSLCCVHNIWPGRGFLLNLFLMAVSSKRRSDYIV